MKNVKKILKYVPFFSPSLQKIARKKARDKLLMIGSSNRNVAVSSHVVISVFSDSRKKRRKRSRQRLRQ